LTIDNFISLYQVVYDSDILHEHQTLRQLFNYFYVSHSSEITITEKNLKRSLTSANTPEIGIPNYMNEIQALKSLLFQNGEFSDFTINSKDGKSFLLHKCIVRNIEYFDILLKNAWGEDDTLAFF
jgi:hypothetical protein